MSRKQAVFSEGHTARLRGEPMTENPYPDFSQVHGQWNDGWRSARNAFLPCPICRGIEGCDHSLPERRAAADGTIYYS